MYIFASITPDRAFIIIIIIIIVIVIVVVIVVIIIIIILYNFIFFMVFPKSTKYVCMYVCMIMYVGVTTHFSEIIKLQFGKERHTLLCILKLFTNIVD